jgi:hypothetical protein
MIYIYFPFHKSVYNIHTFTIPMHYMIDSIYLSLKEHSFNVKIITNPNQLYKHKLNKGDLLIIYQKEFLHSFRKLCIPSKLEEYLNGIEKQVILLVTEEMEKRSMIKQVQEKCIHSVWDFSEKNKRLYRPYNINCLVVPNGYHPCVKWNKKKVTKDIDFFFYGSMGHKRNKIINDLKDKGYHVVFKNCNSEDEFIDKVCRTKIILIIHRMDDERCVDFYRLSCLLTNNVFVIHEDVDHEYRETKKKFDKIIYTPYESIIDTAEYYINMTQNERDGISNEITQWWIKNHPIQNYIPFSIFQNNESESSQMIHTHKSLHKLLQTIE